MSFKPEVIADDSGRWHGNGLRFATAAEAQVYVTSLALRWTSVRDTRVIEADEPATHRMDNGWAQRIGEGS